MKAAQTLLRALVFVGSLGCALGPCEISGLAG
jgi:hypothetical protein